MGRRALSLELNLFNEATMKKILIALSLSLNVILATTLWFNQINSPIKQNGVLKEDIKIGVMGGKKPILTLPKGLTVRNASPRNFDAIDLFEPHRFTITVTSDQELVEYDAPNPHKWGSLYSVEGFNKKK